MINTMYQLDAIGTPKAFLASLLIGIAFGFFLEQSGFGSSRKLTGVFYLKDMAVIKVMLTAVMTALLGLVICISLGWVALDSIYLMPTIYGAYIVGGLIFGIGFVMGGWCPGTAAAGLAGGRIDALIFLIGAVLGSALFNETFALIKPVYESANVGVVFVYDSLGIGRNGFILLLSIAAIAMFWGCEWIEKRKKSLPVSKNSSVLKALTLALLTISLSLFIFDTDTASVASPVGIEAQLLQAVEQAQDHIDPEELADRMLRGEPDLTVVDIRPENEYVQYHLPRAQNIPMKDIHQALMLYQNKGTIVLYSNGMTHPVQARDSLYRVGFRNVYILTDGLNGFIDRCLTPVSLRSEPVSAEAGAKINAWRNFFLVPISVKKETEPTPETSTEFLVDVEWLEKNLNRSDLKVIDLRPQPEYNTSHIPNSLAFNVENIRTNINGVGSILQPAEMLGQHVSSMGILPTDMVVTVYGDKTQDATLVAIALERLGHLKYAVLNGGFGSWASANKPLSNKLPEVTISNYPITQKDYFSVDYRFVLQNLTNKKVIILDVRDEDYYKGAKSDEARAGHIPGAVNRPYTEDIIKNQDIPQFKLIKELGNAYSQIIPSRDSEIIVHCRTGHQASQTFFVLKRLLKYNNVFWYDAGWSEWAARTELPAEISK
jgi:3-mercaptopyruvate sulfurtransferase SseA/uncharacterized membrane protein YedE/YeeE